MVSLEGLDVVQVFLVGLNAWVVNIWHLLKVSRLVSLVLVSDQLLLVGAQGQEVSLISSGQGLVMVDTVVDLLGQNWHQWVALVTHRAVSDSLEGRLEGGILDSLRLLWVCEGVLQLGEGTRANAVEQVLHVRLLVALDVVEHVVGTVVEMVLEINSGVLQEVDEGALLHELVLVVNSHVLHLLLGVLEVLHLSLLNNISPDISELLELVVGVDVVEHGELGGWEPLEVTGLSNTEVEGNQELVVEDHASHPFVVGPATELGDRGDSGDVAEQKDNTTTGAGKRLVVWGDLFWSDGLEQKFHVLVVGVDQWGAIGVIWVLVTRLHLVQLILIVGLGVRLVIWLDSLGWALVKLLSTSGVSNLESILDRRGGKGTSLRWHDHSLEIEVIVAM